VDAAPEDSGAPNADGGASSPGLTADGKVILNLATITDLRKLPGIGQKRAQAILDLRQKLGGRFRKLTDLLRVKGIGVKRLAKLKDKMVLDPPPPS
jgi:competence protein ComEA